MHVTTNDGQFLFFKPKRSLDQTKMMFRASFVLITMMVFAVVLATAEDAKYSDKYDDINVDEILENNRLRDQYYKCFVGTGPCITPDAKQFKKNFPEAIVTQCKKCTEKQKKMMDKLASWYVENREEEWKVLVSKFLEDVKMKSVS